MGARFSLVGHFENVPIMLSFFDLPDNFYYTDLRSALEGFGISTNGIHQIQTLLPLSDAKDREILRVILMKLVARNRKGETKLYSDHISSQLKAMGLSEAAVFQLYEKLEPITDPRDRLTLLGSLAALLVRNEDHVPRGLTGPHRVLWKHNQMKKKS